MGKVGGARQGAGRPKGSVSKRSVDAVATAMAKGISPVEYMLSIMRDEDADSKRREWAAEKAAPYVHPRPTPLDRAIRIELPETTTLEGVDVAQAKVLQSVADGEITPSHGQSLSNLIESRRKAIETNELLVRLERLEEAISNKGAHR